MKVLIAGAGIAGLTTALSLHARGIEAQVIDSVRQLRPLGVGINLLPHAVAELAELGLADALAATAIPTAAAVHYDRFGNEIWRESRGLAAGHEWPQYSIHRGELHTILLRAVRDRLGAGAVREGLRLTTIVESAEQVHCRIRDRATDSLIDWNADVLIGADGLHSVVRAHLHPEEGGPRWNGIQMWRGTAERAPFLDGRTMILAGSSTAARFVAYPISRAAQQRGRSLVNWVAEVRVHEGAVADPDWNRIGRIDDVLPHYAGWRIAGVDIAELIAASGRSSNTPWWIGIRCRTGVAGASPSSAMPPTPCIRSDPMAVRRRSSVRAHWRPHSPRAPIRWRVRHGISGPGVSTPMPLCWRTGTSRWTESSPWSPNERRTDSRGSSRCSPPTNYPRSTRPTVAPAVPYRLRPRTSRPPARPRCPGVRVPPR